LKAIKFALLGTVFALSGATAANAADVFARESFKDAQTGYAPITWTGFYLGAHAGMAFADELAFVDKIDGGTERIHLDNAFVGGVQLGYNQQGASNLVYGVEADLSLLNDDLGDGDTNVTDFLASVRGRLGISLGNSLLYATGGVAFLGYASDFTDILKGDEFKIDDTAVGYVVGAGIEHKFRNNFSIGLEGLYYNFSSDIKDVSDCGCDFNADLDRDFWVLRARASYHFNAPYERALK
jgi:outer membrane immunogenic protein